MQAVVQDYEANFDWFVFPVKRLSLVSIMLFCVLRVEWEAERQKYLNCVDDVFIVLFLLITALVPYQKSHFWNNLKAANRIARKLPGKK